MPSANLVLNFSPVQFDDVKLTVGCLPCRADGKQALQQLGREHKGTHIFHRDGRDKILAVCVDATAALVGEREEIRLKEHLGLAAVLVRNSLLTLSDPRACMRGGQVDVGRYAERRMHGSPPLFRSFCGSTLKTARNPNVSSGEMP
jgi:hypothetical protein